MKYEISKLVGAVLDGAVALAEGLELGPDWNQEAEVLVGSGKGQFPYRKYKPSRSWAEAGPIITREHIAIAWDKSAMDVDAAEEPWFAGISHGVSMGGDVVLRGVWSNGASPLVAAMRAYVASKFGEAVELP